MKQRVLRVVLTVTALVLTLAGSVNLKNANAGLCDGVCGCPGGTVQCCTWEGVTCYTKDTPPPGGDVPIESGGAQ